MAKSKASTRKPAASAGLFEAFLQMDGSVQRGVKVTMTQAEAMRKAGKNVVVCGSDGNANRQRAHSIETNANGNAK
jgi:hypothetical protein